MMLFNHWFYTALKQAIVCLQSFVLSLYCLTFFCSCKWPNVFQELPKTGRFFNIFCVVYCKMSLFTFVFSSQSRQQGKKGVSGSCLSKKWQISSWILSVVLNANFFLLFFYLRYYCKISNMTVEKKCVQEKKSKAAFFYTSVSLKCSGPFFPATIFLSFCFY